MTARVRLGALLGALLAAGALPACGDETAQGPRGAASSGPVYALHTLVFDPEFNATSYVALTDTIELDRFEFDTAREFAGYAFVAAVDGRLLVSDGESPLIRRHEIDAELGWTEVDVLSFANQGITGGGASFERQWFRDENTAYITLDVLGRVVWDPKRFEITAVVDESSVPLELDGLRVDATFNRQARVTGGPLLKPFFYHDDDWFEFAGTTRVVSYDPITHEETSIVDVPCPALEVPSVDEAGNTYLSPWTFGPVTALYGVGPELCIRRMTPAGALDATWTPDLRAWTDGRPVKVFRYLRDGKALGTVLHVEELEADFTLAYDPDVDAEAEAHYRLWLFDLDAETARPVEGIGPMNSGFHWANFDERTFVFVPTEDWSSTAVYEVDTDGGSSLRFETTGRLTDWVRVR